MIAPHKRTPVFAKWKEVTRRDYGLDVRDDRPFAIHKKGKEIRINTDHSVIISLQNGELKVWNKPLQHAGKPLSLEEMTYYQAILVEVWRDIEGDVE